MNLASNRLRSGGQLAFRILFSLIFIVAGGKHLFAPDHVVARLLHAPGAALVTALPPKPLVVLAGAALLAGGVALALGLLTRWAAIGLALVLIPITLTVQIGNPEGVGPLFKNIALLGGLLHWALEGAGALSVDAWLKSRVRFRPAAVGAVGLLVLAAALPARAAGTKAPATAPARASQERVLFLVQQPPQLEAALMTGEQSLAGEGFPAREVEVVVCGPASSSLLQGSAMAPKLAEARRAGVHVAACGLTLAKKGIDRGKLLPGVQVVENGLVEALKRQAEGFRSVEL